MSFLRICEASKFSLRMFHVTTNFFQKPLPTYRSSFCPNPRIFQCLIQDQVPRRYLLQMNGKVRSHPDNISNIISNVVSNSSRVTQVMFGDTVDKFSNKTPTNISSLGVDTTTDTAKHSNARASQSKTGDYFRENCP